MTDEKRYRQVTKRYVLGAFGAIVATELVYMAVTEVWFMNMTWLAVFALAMALIQLAIQLFTFLHLGTEAKPRWKTQSFLFAFLMALVIVVGSIWIMINLNYNMRMTPEQMKTYMQAQNKKGF